MNAYIYIKISEETHDFTLKEKCNRDMFDIKIEDNEYILGS